MYSKKQITILKNHAPTKFKPHWQRFVNWLENSITHQGTFNDLFGLSPVAVSFLFAEVKMVIDMNKHKQTRTGS